MSFKKVIAKFEANKNKIDKEIIEEIELEAVPSEEAVEEPAEETAESPAEEEEIEFTDIDFDDEGDVYDDIEIEKIYTQKEVKKAFVLGSVLGALVGTIAAVAAELFIFDD